MEVAREFVYGSAGCPEWGTTFAEIESDARKVGYELMLLLIEQTSTQQVSVRSLAGGVERGGHADWLGGPHAGNRGG